MKTAGCAIVLALTLPWLAGCASIVGGTTQIVSVQALNDGESLKGAICRLENAKNAATVLTPGTVAIHRAYGDLAVTCEKDNLAPGTATVKSSTKAMAYGNILLGGVIGAAVDVGNGAAYDYPASISVVMGQNISLPAVAPKNAKSGKSPPRASDPLPPAEPVPATLPVALPPAPVLVALPPAATTAATAPSVIPAASEAAPQHEAQAVDAHPVSAPATPSPAPAAIPGKPVAPGRSSWTVEMMAKQQGCSGRSGAELLAEHGSTQEYRMRCDDGKVFLARCDQRHCTAKSQQ